MSVVLYKDGKSKVFNHNDFRRFLSAGWSLESPERKQEKLEAEEAKESKRLESVELFMLVISSSMAFVADNLTTTDELKEALESLKELSVDPDVFLNETEDTEKTLTEMIDNLGLAITEIEKEEADALLEKEKNSTPEEETTEAETGGEENPEKDVLKISVDEDLSGLGDIKVTAAINLDNLSNKEVRDLAKSNSIDGHDTARIDTLKEALGNVKE